MADSDRLTDLYDRLDQMDASRGALTMATACAGCKLLLPCPPAASLAWLLRTLAVALPFFSCALPLCSRRARGQAPARSWL